MTRTLVTTGAGDVDIQMSRWPESCARCGGDFGIPQREAVRIALEDAIAFCTRGDAGVQEFYFSWAMLVGARRFMVGRDRQCASDDDCTLCGGSLGYPARRLVAAQLDEMVTSLRSLEATAQNEGAVEQRELSEVVRRMRYVLGWVALLGATLAEHHAFDMRSVLSDVVAKLDAEEVTDVR